MSRTLIGVDVCKDFLDAHARPAGVKHRFDNTPAGIEQLVAWAQPLAPERVVLESTGPYQKAAVGALLAAGLPAVVVNARQVRAFAKGTGQLAKTDVLDAAILAPFADDSGTCSRIRHIRGGRAKVRIALYQAAVSAIRYCAVMKAFYAALKARGKASKVALIAVARKLLVLANALLRTGTPYQPRTNSVCPKNA